jgi:hypothetical protein
LPTCAANRLLRHEGTVQGTPSSLGVDIFPSLFPHCSALALYCHRYPPCNVPTAATDEPGHNALAPPTVGRDATDERSPKTDLQPVGTAAFVCRERPINNSHHQPPSGFTTNLASFARPPWCSPTPLSTLTTMGQSASPLFPFSCERLDVDRHCRSRSGAASASMSFYGSMCASLAAQASTSATPPLPH